MAFVFYDTETTGTHKSFDQILQFAAIKTDADLNEIDRFEIRCRLMPHVVPSAGALRVTRVSIDSILDLSLPSHYEMMCKVCSKLSGWGKSIFSGWNTMEFDEQLLRQALFQCLHPPYLTNSDGNCRADILKVAQALTVLRPGTLTVPVGANGKPTYKLDILAPANGFPHLNAHDALADVEATIHIAKLIRDRAPDIWSSVLRFSQKNSVIEFLEDERAFVLTESYFSKPYQYALAKIGCDADNESLVYAIDLTADFEALRSLDDQALAKRLARSPKPVRRIRANRCPLVTSMDDVDHFGGIAAEEFCERGVRIREDAAFCMRLIAALHRAEDAVSEHIEERLYESFIASDDQNRMTLFHRADWEERARIVETFGDDRLTELGRRLIFYHHPNALSAEQQAAHRRFVATRLLGHGYASVPWLTAVGADEEAAKLLEGCTEEERLIIGGARGYFGQRIAEARLWV